MVAVFVWASLNFLHTRLVAVIKRCIGKFLNGLVCVVSCCHIWQRIYQHNQVAKTVGMTMQNAIRISMLIIATGVLVSACDSGQNQEMALDPESYEYKGAVDPLTQVSGADRAGDLASRFDLIQGRQ